MSNKKMYVHLDGENFDPYKLQQELNITLYNKRKKGDIGVTGRFKDIPFDCGSADFNFSNLFDFEIDSLLDCVEKISTEKYQIENIILHIDYYYDYQCNLEFNQEILSRFAKLNINLSISAIKK